MPYKYQVPDGTPASSREAIERDFRLWNAQAGEAVIWDYDLPMQRPGVTEAVVRFSLRGKTLEVKIDRWPTFSQNLKAAALNINAMRLMEARGSLEAMAETLRAIPAHAEGVNPWHVLGLTGEAEEAVARAAVKQLRAKYHTDNIDTGNAAEYLRIGAAWDAICAKNGWRP